MKATGIVRRIDDLGRVVIPKEIRRTLRIKEGTPLEIFTDREGEVILKKYSPIGELSIFAKEYVEALAQTTGMTACITDHDQVVAASGHGSREYEGKGISRELDRVIAEREMKCYYGEEKGKIALVPVFLLFHLPSKKSCCRLYQHLLRISRPFPVTFSDKCN